MGQDAELIFKFLLFLFVGVPTLVFYIWPVLFGWLAVRPFIKGRSRWMTLPFAVLAVAPLAWYSTRYSAAVENERILTARLTEAARLPPLKQAPRTLIVHGSYHQPSQWQDRLIEMGAFDEIYFIWNDKKSRLANARGKNCDRGTRGNVHSQDVFRARTGFLVCATETAADSVPADGVHLFLRSSETDRAGRQIWPIVFDLRLIEGAQQRQIGFHASYQVHAPMFPPMLSLAGFEEGSELKRSPVPWHGELPFLFERLSIDAGSLKPHAQPSPEEVRAEYLRLRDSAQFADHVVAGYIATAVGAAALGVEDIEPLLQTNAIDTDFGREIGFQQFCYHINRLCDFPDLLIAACKSKRGFTPEKAAASPAVFRRCERLPRMCNWCRSNETCQPFMTGRTANCSDDANVSRDAALRPLREDRDD